ncbi:hypothetical protein HPB49_024014 [Dermacentor silvarum]|uniref:Uncharacterized protein n=1 Tax=Dermacentor silvarum TaxID=543639 RepID=A0ACB8D8M6_DERSI|nr:hypothetical protein HPB49_024014 [Dermacentor silvarum]
MELRRHLGIRRSYGNIAPKTNWGKIVTILYAIVGIPLMLLYLTNIGDILAKAFKYVYRRLCSCDHRGGDSSSRRAQAASYYGSSTRRAAGAHCRVNHIALEDGLLAGEAINGFAAADRIGQDVSDWLGKYQLKFALLCLEARAAGLESQ